MGRSEDCDREGVGGCPPDIQVRERTRSEPLVTANTVPKPSPITPTPIRGGGIEGSLTTKVFTAARRETFSRPISPEAAQSRADRKHPDLFSPTYRIA